MTPVEDMKLMHWGKSKINLGLGKRKNPHIQTGLMGTGLCLGLCLLLVQRGHCLHLLPGWDTVGLGLKGSNLAEQVESILLLLSFLARPLSICFANRALKTSLEEHGCCSQPSSSIHSRGWAIKPAAQIAQWAPAHGNEHRLPLLSLPTSCFGGIFVNTAELLPQSRVDAAEEMPMDNNQSIDRWL